MEDAKPHASDCNEEPEREMENRQHLARDYRKSIWLKDSKCDLDFCYRLKVHVPDSFEQAQESDNSLQWKQAMDEELESLVDNDTFELTVLPRGLKLWRWKMGLCRETGYWYK